MSDSTDDLLHTSALSESLPYEHFTQFYDYFNADLEIVEHYLKQAGESLEGKYTSMYQHWYKALRDLRQGIHLLAKRIPVPSPGRFLEALKIFSFSGAACFIRDIAIICNIPMEQNWAARFQNHIMLLLQAHDQILGNQMSRQR